MLRKIYEDQQTVDRLVEQIFSLLKEHFSDLVTENLNKWTQNEILMITYGDSICAPDEKPSNGTQYTLHPLNNSLFAFWRQSTYREQSIFCLNNLSDRTQVLHLSDINLICIDPWHDLLSGQIIEDIHARFILQPYQWVWITNQ